MSQSTYGLELLNHYKKHWGPLQRRLFPQRGAVQDLPAGMFVGEYHPEDSRGWVYATIGASADNVKKLEFFIVSNCQTEDLVDSLCAVVYYMTTGPHLDLGHTINLGIPWLCGSQCDYLLLSLPYLDGPSLEMFRFGDKQLQCVWLIPITKSERDYKISHGLESLERLFDSSNFEYANPSRQSLV